MPTHRINQFAFTVLPFSIVSLLTAPVLAEEPALALPAFEPAARAAVDGQIGFIETPALTDTTILSLIPNASLALGSRIAVHGNIPLLWGRAEKDSSATPGNLTLGGHYHRPLSPAAGDGAALQFGASVSLPTAARDGLAAQIADARAFLEVTDPGQYLSHTTTFRAHAGYGIGNERLFSKVRLTGQFLRTTAAEPGEMQIFGDANQLRVASELASGLRIVRGLWLLGELAANTALIRGDAPRFLSAVRAGGRYRLTSGLGIGAHLALPLNGDPRNAGGLCLSSYLDTTF
jgi:hypothetical protein